MGGLSGAKVRKVFFSEEKKQKTFANSGVCAACKVRDSTEAKVFWFFSSEKNTFFPALPLPPAPRLDDNIATGC